MGDNFNDILNLNPGKKDMKCSVPNDQPLAHSVQSPNDCVNHFENILKRHIQSNN